MVGQADLVKKQNGTPQGHYAFDASGKLLGSVNFNFGPEETLAMLNQALTRFEPPHRPVTTGDTIYRRKPRPPPGTVTVEVYSRIAPTPDHSDRLNTSIGRDHLWILPSEIQTLIAGQFPDALKRRIVSWHLADNIRGEPDEWRPEDITRADFRLTAKDLDGSIHVTFSGPFALRAAAGKRGPRSADLPETGFEGILEGELLYDTATRAVTRFVAYAEGAAWGEQTFTRGAPPGRFPLKIAFVQVRDGLASDVPPAGAVVRSPEYYLGLR